MKGNFQRFVQEGELINFQFAPEPMKNVMSEILNLLAAHEGRLDAIVSQCEVYALKTEVEELRERNNELQTRVEKFEEATEQSISDFRKKFDYKIEELREYTDMSNASVLVSAQRYIGTEVKDLIQADREKLYASLDLDTLREKVNALDERTKCLIEEEAPVESHDPATDAKPEVPLPKPPGYTRARENSNFSGPIAKQGRMIEDLQTDMFTCQSKIAGLERNLEAVRNSEPPVRTKVEVIVQRPDPPSSSHPTSPAPPPAMSAAAKLRSQIMEPEVAAPPKPVIVMPTIPPPLEDNASMERQLRRLNEIVNNFKFTMEALKEVGQQHAEKIGSMDQQMKMRNITTAQGLEQLQAQLDRLSFGGENDEKAEDVDGVSPDRIGQLARDVAELKQALEDLSTKHPGPGNHGATRHVVQYAETRVRPPLESIPVEDEREDETFGLGEDSDPPVLSGGPSLSGVTDSGMPSGREPVVTGTVEEAEDLTPEATPDKGGPRRDVQVRIIKQGGKGRDTAYAGGYQVPQMSQTEIEEKVDAAVKKSIAGFMDRAKVEAAREVQRGLKVVDELTAHVDTKIDREFVERMFNKFRIVVADLKEKIDQIGCTFMSWVTREELHEVLQKFVGELADVNDTAGSASKYNCLLCGKPRSHVSGMMVIPQLEKMEEDEPESVESPPLKKIHRPNVRTSSAQLQKRTLRKPRQTYQPRNIVDFITSAPTDDMH